MRRSITRNLILATMTVVLIFVAVVSLAFVSNATSVKTLMIEDDFDNGFNAKIWSKSGQANVNDTEGVLRLTGINWGDSINIQKNGSAETPNFLPDNYVIQVDFRMLETSGWAGIVVGIPSPDSRHDNDMGTQLIFENKKLNIFEAQRLVMQKEIVKKLDTFEDFYNKTWVTVKISVTKGSGVNEEEIKQNTRATIDFKRQSDADFTTFNQISLSSITPNGFMGFMTGGATVEYDNLSIYSTDSNFETIHETFDTNVVHHKLTGGGEDPSTANRLFRAWNQIYDGVFCGKGKVFNFFGQGSLFSNQPIIKDNQTTYIFALQTNISVRDSGSPSFGFGFGKATKDESVKANQTITFLKKGDTLIAKGKNEVEIDLGTVFPEGAEGTTIRLLGKYNHTIEIYVDNTFKGEVAVDKLDGYFEIFSNGAQFAIDKLSVDNYKFEHTDSRAMSINFEGKKKNGQKGYIDFNQWYQGGQALGTKNGELMFIEAGADSAFGPKAKYGDFIMKFTVRDVVKSGSSWSTWLGISIGRSSRSMMPMQAPVALLASTVGNNASMYLETLNMGAKTSANFPKSLWDENIDEDFYFVVIAKNRTITIYMKTESQDEFVMDTPIATITDVNTYGYVSIIAHEKGNFTIDDFSIIPLE